MDTHFLFLSPASDCTVQLIHAFASRGKCDPDSKESARQPPGCAVSDVTVVPTRSNRPHRFNHFIHAHGTCHQTTEMSPDGQQELVAKDYGDQDNWCDHHDMDTG